MRHRSRPLPLLALCLLFIASLAPPVTAHAPSALTSALFQTPVDVDHPTDTVDVGGERWQRLEARANTHRPGRQYEPALLIGEDGRFTVTWQSRRQEGRGHELYAQRFDPLGRRLGGETRINEALRPDQGNVCGTLLENGTIACSWQALGQDGSLGGAVIRMFDGRLVPLTGDLVANERTSGNQADTVCAALPDGGLLVAWSGPGDQGALPRAWARCFDALGRPAGPEFRLGHAALAGEKLPAVAVFPDGGFVAAYAALDADGRPAGVYGRRFSADGDAGAPRKLNGGADLGAIEPVVAAAPDGRFLAAWLEHGGERADYDVRAMLFGADGRPRGPAFTVHESTAGIQNAPAAAFLPDGRFAVAWNHCTEGSRGSDVMARLFHAGGDAQGRSFRLTRAADGEQRLAGATGRLRLAAGDQGQLALAWSGAGEGPADDHGAFFTLLLPERAHIVAGAEAEAEVRRTAAFDAIRTACDAARAGRPAVGDEPRVFAGLADEAVPHQPPVWDPKRRVEQLPYGGDPSPVPLADDGFFGVASTGWTPPDPHLAVGPEHVVVMTNGAIAFFTKEGTQTFIDEIEDSYGFWGGQGATNFVFDPEVIYDPHAGRFMAMANERGTSSDSYFLLAVSDDADPNGTWYKYRINATPHCGSTIDSPNIAVDGQAVYLTADCWTSNNYVIYILDKTPLLSGGSATVTNVLTISGPQSHGIPVTYGSAPAMYMIEHFESSSNTSVRLHAITDPLGTPSRVTHTLTVPSYSPPEDPPQLGSSIRPETFDSRFWSCVWRNGSLWACHHVGGSRVLARWYEIDTGNWPASGSPSLVQSGTVDPGSGVRAFFNAISVDDAGNAAMVFARSSSSEYISMARASRCADDPAGTMPDQAILKASTTGYNTSRWGDYSAVAVDPADGVTFWMHHEYTTSSSSWSTWIASHDPECTPQVVDTVATTLGCVPDSGTLPFASQFWVQLENLTTENRRAAARIDAQIASGGVFGNWRAGWTNLDPGEVFTTYWNQNFPALGSLVGHNVFTLVCEDVTPSPYNQPPYAPAGDTDSASCTVTAASP